MSLVHVKVNTVESVENVVFRSSLHPPDSLSRLDIVRANSKTSLDQTGSFMSTSGTFQQQRAFSRQTRREEEEEGDDGENESEEEEEGDEDEEEDTDDEH